MTHAPAETPTPLDPALVALAISQDGMLTTAQAGRAGLDAFALGRLVRCGRLLHPGKGLYAVASLVDQAPEPWHRHLTRGANLLYDDVVFTGVTALLAHGVTLWRANLAKPEILRPVRRSSTLTCFRQRPLRGDAFVTTPLGKTLPLAKALMDYAIDSQVESSVVSFDNALHDAKVTLEDLNEALTDIDHWPGSSRARSALALCDGHRESVAESRVGILLALAMIEVTAQVEVREANGWLVGRVDFLVTGTKVIIEVDGKIKYASGDPEVLWREKRREDALRRLGYLVVRVTWADIETPGRVVAKVRAALADCAA